MHWLSEVQPITGFKEVDKTTEEIAITQRYYFYDSLFMSFLN